MPSVANSPGQIVRQLLVNKSVAGNPADDPAWPSYYGGVPDKPDELISVGDTTGNLQNSIHISGENAEAFGIQILVRSQNRADGWTRANTIMNSMDTGVRLVSVTVGGTTYTIHTMTRTSPIISLGKEQGGNVNRYLFTINYLATITQNS